MTIASPTPTYTPDVELDVGIDMALALTAERGWPPQWRPAPHHEGLACAVIDAVMSPHVRSETVAAVVTRYKRHHSSDDGPHELLHSFAHYGARWPDIIGTRNRAWRSPQAPLKSDVIEAAANLLTRHGVTTPDALLERARDPHLRSAWAELPGQASGATWRHLLLVTGFREPVVCPLTRSFARRYVPYIANCASDGELLTVMSDVARTLAVPVYDIDHQMWRAGARGRPLG